MVEYVDLCTQQEQQDKYKAYQSVVTNSRTFYIRYLKHDDNN